MTWTHFYDMNSGGGTKENYAHIFIQAPEKEAKVIFYNRFGHNPERISCTCCGEDYSISEDDSLEQLTAYHRNCATVSFYLDDNTEVDGEAVYDYVERHWMFDGRKTEQRYVERANLGLMKYGYTKKKCIDRYQTLKQYLADPYVLAIHSEDILESECVGSIPEQGYVWRD